MPAVSVPSDSLYKLGGLSISALDNCRDMTSVTSGRVVVAPTAFTVKKDSLFSVEISAMHPGWYYTGLQYSTEASDLYVKIQQSLSDVGVNGSISVPNPKADSLKQSLIGELMPIRADLAVMDNIPLHYYGQPIDTKLPSDTTKNNTFLTQVIDENFVKVTMQSPYEFEIEVVASPTEDQWFYIPVANPKGLSSTIWGKVGNESTLPVGACAGLIKVYSEALLDTSLGGYTVTGDELAAVRRTSEQMVATLQYSVGEWWADTSSEDDHFSQFGQYYQYNLGSETPDEVKKAFVETFLNIPSVSTLSKLISEQKPWYAMGYRTRACTVGTGLFACNRANADGVATTSIYPYGNTFTGLVYSRDYSPNLSAPTYEIRMGDMLDCGDFLESVAKMGQITQDVDVGTVLPLCAADIQYKSHLGGPTGSYNIPDAVMYRYGQPSFEGTTVLTTPLYLNREAGYHCYIPRLSFTESTRFHMLTATDVNELVQTGLVYSNNLISTDVINVDCDVESELNSRQNLWTTYWYRYGGSSYIVDHDTTAHLDAVTKLEGATPNKAYAYTDPIPVYNLTLNPELIYASASDPTQGFFYDQAGFVIQRACRYRSGSIETRKHSYLNGSVVPSSILANDDQFHTYHRNHVEYEIKYTWHSSSDLPVVGKASSTSLKTLGAGVAGITMVFAGYIPAGSAVGIYKFKPFVSTQAVSGVLSCDPTPQFVPVSCTGSLSLESTDAPYFGVNYVYVEGPNLCWAYDVVPDERNDYEFYRVMLGVEVDRMQKTTLVENVVVAIDAEQVPLIGYPIAERPVMIQIDDATGVHLSDIEDLAISNPFYDSLIDEWVVVGASIAHGKMYRIHVGMDPTLNHVVEFKSVRDSADLFETPYGKFTKLLGLCQTKDIHYLDEHAEETKKAMAADVLFLVDDSGSMGAMMTELKAKINEMFTTLYTTGVEDVRVGIACYDTKQQSVYYNAGGSNQPWATSQDQAQSMADQLKMSFIPGTHSRSALHFNAIDWALGAYTFRDVKSRYIILITDTGLEVSGTTKTLVDVQDKLVARNVRVNVVSGVNHEAFYTPLVSATDGTFITTETIDNKTWGTRMAEELGSKMISEIKATYTISVADDHLVIYGITDATASSLVKGSNLVVATCRTYMQWDANKDTVVRIPIIGTDVATVNVQHIANMITNTAKPVQTSYGPSVWDPDLVKYKHKLGYTVRTVTSFSCNAKAEDGSLLTCTVNIGPYGAYEITGDVEGGSIYNPDEKDGLLSLIWSKPITGNGIINVVSYKYTSVKTYTWDVDGSEAAPSEPGEDGTGTWAISKLNPSSVPSSNYLYWSIPDFVPSDYAIGENVLWPHGVAVLFPYIYVLGYTYTQHPESPDSYDGVSSDMLVVDKGWQMCMWKIDITAGLVSDPILIKDSACFRFGFGVPARDKDARDVLRAERLKIGAYPALYTSKDMQSGMMTRSLSAGSSTISFAPGVDEDFEKKVRGLKAPSLQEVVNTGSQTITTYSTADHIKATAIRSRARQIPLAGSSSLPSKTVAYQFPSLSGICGVAGQLLVFSNYHECPMLLNPLTGVLETTGLSIFPFTYPFDSNVTVSGDTLSTLATFNGFKVYTTHPFYQLCIGDGVSPNVYGMGIDVHDITTGQTLVRRCYVRNNNLRDKLVDITLSVPSELVLPGSDMLWLSTTGLDTDKVKVLRLPTTLHPCEQTPFYLHVIPATTYNDDNLILYLNAKFSRVTEYFGYLSR